MEQPEPLRIVTVGRLAKHMRDYLERNVHLRSIGIRGEVSNLHFSPAGIVYFDLKDDEALLSCVVFSKDAAKLPALANGQAVVAVGYVSIYEKTSKFQLVASIVKVDGIGDLHAAYEELKRKLHAEGLFDEVRKRAIPRYPFRIALVSSRGAAGAGDFEEIVRKRAPHVRIEWFETPVQNMTSVPEIVDAIDRASAREEIDVIVVARGGGSFEDLFPFSTESVVRAIARARHPVVAAVGHNVDLPLCDLVADWRAPTPSAAAARVAPDVDEIRKRLEHYRSAFAIRARLIGPLEQRLDHLRERFLGSVREVMGRKELATAQRRERLFRHDAGPAIARRRERLAVGRERLRSAAGACLAKTAARLNQVRLVLEGNDPARILQHGYAIVTVGERVVRDAADVSAGDEVRARLGRGALRARVEATEQDERQENR